jgi:hypothetical protein
VGGADPLLGFHLLEVFASLATAVPFTQRPLTHFYELATEVGFPSVPQSLNEQENWLASLEAADLCEIFVLILPTPDGLGLVLPKKLMQHFLDSTTRFRLSL